MIAKTYYMYSSIQTSYLINVKQSVKKKITGKTWSKIVQTLITHDLTGPDDAASDDASTLYRSL